MKVDQLLSQVKRHRVSFSEFKLLARDIVELKGGHRVVLTKDGFRDLLRIIGINEKSLSALDGAFGSENNVVSTNLTKEVIKALGQRKNQFATLLFDDQNRIIRISDKDDIGGSVTPSQMHNILEIALNQNPKIILSQTLVDAGGTKASFHIKWNEPIKLQIKGEDIVVGKVINWDMLGKVTVSDYLERLICDNGMTNHSTNAAIPVLADPSDLYAKVYDGLKNPNQALIEQYMQNLDRARNTKLTVLEYNKIKSAIEPWADDNARIVRVLGAEQWKSEYVQRGIDLEKLTVAQLNNCPTPVNAWEAINVVTDLASHREYKSNVSDSTRRWAMGVAGKMLKGTWGQHGLVANVPKFD